MATKKGKLSDLIPDRKNANKHSQFGMKLLENSVTDLGLGRSILVSNDNEIIAGNGVAETAMANGLEKTIVVETTGDELVVVKRMDIKSGTDKFFKMALADNVVASKNIVFDADVVEAIAEEYGEVSSWTEHINTKPKPMAEGEEEVDLSQFDKAADSYMNNPIKQIVLFFETDKHKEVLAQMEEIGKVYGIVEDNTAVFLKLIDFYYDTIRTEKKAD